MKRKLFLALPILLLIVTFFSTLKVKTIRGIPSSSLKDTLSSSQLSYFGRIGSAVTTGDSIIRISLTSGTAPSDSTDNLFIGDTVGIGTTGSGVGSSGPLTKYTILDIGNTQSIQINTGIGQSNAFIGAAIVATRSAIHTINFTPQSNIAGGFWQFLIKATSRTGEVNNDGIPDQQGFDLGQDVGSTTVGLGTRLKALDVTCPNWGTGVTSAFSIGATTAVTSGGATNYYHVVTCYLGVGGTNQIGVGYSMTVGRDLTSGSQLINPSASLSHVHGRADSTGPDVYTFYVRHLDAGQVLLDADTAQGKIAVVEAVRVTATIDPTITFYIDNTNVGQGSTACGLPAYSSNANDTTADTVSFGSINLTAQNNLAQRLSCVTNAFGGYVVTVFEQGQMKNISTGATLPDTTCPSNTCTVSSPAVWNTFTASGWGYTMQNINVGTSIFDYAAGFKPFGNGTANAQQIMKNTATPAATEVAYICYRVVASTSQAAGNYENKLVYTATATF